MSIISSSTQTFNPDGSGNNLRLIRSLDLLLHVVKEQASGRLAKTKVNLQKIAPEVFKMIAELYVKCVEAWSGIIQQGFQTAGVQSVLEVMGISLRCLKSLRRLAISGYEFPNRVDEVREMWVIFKNQVSAFLAISASANLQGEANVVQKPLRKHILGLGKMFIDFSQLHSTAFALLPDTLEILQLYWSAIEAYGTELGTTAIQAGEAMLRGEEVPEVGDEEAERLKFMDRLALQGMLLLRASAKMIHNPAGVIKCENGTRPCAIWLICCGRSTSARKGGNCARCQCVQDPAIYAGYGPALYGGSCHKVFCSQRDGFGKLGGGSGTVYGAVGGC